MERRTGQNIIVVAVMDEAPSWKRVMIWMLCTAALLLAVAVPAMSTADDWDRSMTATIAESAVAAVTADALVVSEVLSPSKGWT